MQRLAIVLIGLLAFFSPSPLQALNLYLTDSENAHDLTLKAILESGGHTVTIGVPWYALDGTQDLSGAQVVILQANYNWSGHNMPAAGQTALSSFVSGGGGLITTAWINYLIEDTDDYPSLKALLPVTSPGRDYETPANVTYTLLSPHPTVRDGLSKTISFSPQDIGGSESRLVAKSGAVVYCSTNTLFDSGRGSGVVGWQFGRGRVVCFSTTCGESDFTSPSFRKLFLNMIAWSRQARTRPVLSVRGGNNPKFKTARATVRGTARDSAGITSVTYRVGKKGRFRAAKGNNAWRFNATLKARRTPATIRATNGNGVITTKTVRLVHLVRRR